MKKILRNSIVLRLLFAILIFSSAITILTTALELYVDYRHTVTDLENNLSKIGDTFVPSI